MSKFLYVVGARPQFVKMAVLNRAAESFPGHEQIIVHTGQHYDAAMSDIFYEELDIPQPDYDLGVSGLSHGAMTGRMLEGVEEVIKKEKPDWTIVFGDTNSTLAGALASVKLHVPCAHVEAGLRSFDRAMPEEINRLLADQCSDLLFTPCDSASRQLEQEGVPAQRIRQVGDVMRDAATYYREKATESSRLAEWGVTPGGYLLATVHRAENCDDPHRLRAIVDGLIELGKEMPLLLPLHPRTEKVLETHGRLDELKGGVTLLPPVGYLDMVLLESQAQAIVTDSGGVQKEAYFYDVPCLILRDRTEWKELVDKAGHLLVEPGRESIPSAFARLRNGQQAGDRTLYGEEKVGERVIEAMLAHG